MTQQSQNYRQDKKADPPMSGAVRGNSLKFGSKATCFKDVGVDLNKNKGG